LSGGSYLKVGEKHTGSAATQKKKVEVLFREKGRKIPTKPKSVKNTAL